MIAALGSFIFFALVAIIAFSIMVIAHELGHFLLAKREGVKVEEFGIGFPPRLWSAQVGETVYSLNAIPLGGFVRMFGEEGEGADNPRSFIAQSIGAKSRIIVAGVTMNLILAYILTMGLFWAGDRLLIGRASDYPGVAVKYQRVVILKVEPNSPAKAAGVKTGDELISINGSAYGDDEIVKNTLLKDAGKSVTLRVKRGSQTKDLYTNLRSKSEADKGILGVQLNTSQFVRIPAWEVPYVAFIEVLRAIWLIITSTIGLVAGLFSAHSSTSIGDVSGPVGISVFLFKATSLGFEYVVRLVVFLSISLAVFNILPIPALDGGRLFFMLWGRFIRPISSRLENTIHATGFWLLIALILLISIWDIIRLSTGKLGI